MRINWRHDARILTIWKTFIAHCSHAKTAARHHLKPNGCFKDIRFSKTLKLQDCKVSASSEVYVLGRFASLATETCHRPKPKPSIFSLNINDLLKIA